MSTRTKSPINGAFLGTFVLQNNVWWGYNHD